MVESTAWWSELPTRSNGRHCTQSPDRSVNTGSRDSPRWCVGKSTWLWIPSLHHNELSEGPHYQMLVRISHNHHSLAVVHSYDVVQLFSEADEGVIPLPL